MKNDTRSGIVTRALIAAYGLRDTRPFSVIQDFSNVLVRNTELRTNLTLAKSHCAQFSYGHYLRLGKFCAPHTFSFRTTLWMKTRCAFIPARSIASAFTKHILKIISRSSKPKVCGINVANIISDIVAMENVKAVGYFSAPSIFSFIKRPRNAVGKIRITHDAYHPVSLSLTPSTPHPYSINSFFYVTPKTSLVFIGQFRDWFWSDFHNHIMTFVSAVSALNTRLRHDLFLKAQPT